MDINLFGNGGKRISFLDSSDLGDISQIIQVSSECYLKIYRVNWENWNEWE